MFKNKLLSLYQKTESNLHDLKYLFLELTHQCNISCLHCGSDCVKDPDSEILQKDKIIEVLKEIKTAYNSHEIMIVLSGGEPLCYPGLFDLGRAIYDLEFPWGMVTNGFAWNDKTILQAKKSGMHSVTVSLDGFESEHNLLRGHKQSFERAVNTIKMLIKDPFYKKIDVVTCVHKKNLDTLPDFYKYIKKLGITRWRLFTISPIGRAAQNESLMLSKEEFIKLFDLITVLRSKKEIQVNYSESGFFGHEYDKTIRNQAFFCRAGISVAGIMVNGDILACPNIDRRFSQGNIYTDSFTDVWENKYKVFRNRSWMKTGECRTCKSWSTCKGNSFHLWDLDKSSTRKCYYNMLHA
jgi:radical SAM enzyme (rSAM/lipoprotein system)